MDQAPFSNAAMLPWNLSILAHLLRPRAVRKMALLSLALLVASSCSEHLLQTAILDDSSTGLGGMLPLGGANGAELLCDEGTTGALPGGTEFGEGGEEESSALSSGDYAVSQGPGIVIVARDAFRLFVNGSLLLASDDPRVPIFVPLSLLPGDNVIALAVAADFGTPAALVQVDDLAGPFVSDGTWKFSLEPEEGWTLPGFDDTTWSSAHELAQLGEVPGCDPAGGFPAGSHARWIGPPLGADGPVGLRTVIRIAPMGFGEGTTGGEEAPPEIASDWEELSLLAESDEPKVLLLPEGVHDFRRVGDEISDQEVCPSQCPDDPSKTVYQVLVGEETCPTDLTTRERYERVLHLGSNTTLLGLGRGAALRGVSIDFGNSENIIIRNVAVFDVNPGLIEAGDAFGLFEPSRVWIDHATTRWISDGFTDLRAGTRNVTISYVRYEGESEFDCQGLHPRTSLVEDAQVTFHHNHFNHIRYNAPMASGSDARAHLFNNAFSNVGAWAMSSSCQAAILAEGNVFDGVDAIARTTTCDQEDTLGALDFPAGSNLYRDGAPVFLGGDGSEPHDGDFIPSYEYDLAPASDAWPTVISRAGTGGPWALPLTLD